MNAPLAARVARFLPVLVRAIRATRLYPEGSAARRQHVEPAHLELTELLRDHGPLTLGIRDGLVFFQGEAIYASGERDVFAAVLFASSIFELSFVPGIDLAELSLFIGALGSEEAAQRVPGESLVSLLWRLGLVHVRHKHFELMRVLARPDRAGALHTDWIEDEEAKRLRARVTRIAERLGTNASGSPELRLTHVLSGEQQSALKLARVLLERRLLPGTVVRLLVELTKADTREVLSHRLAVLLIRALAVDPDAKPSSPAAEMIARLLQEMVLSARFEGAARVLTYLRNQRPGSRSSILRATLETLTTAEGVALALRALASAEPAQQSPIALKLGVYLRALGPLVLPALLEHASGLEDSPLLDILAEVIADVAAEHTAFLAARLSELGADLAVKLLVLARAFPEEKRRAIADAGLLHPSPRARLEALAATTSPLRVAQAIHDSDPGVRKLALRLAATHKVEAAVREISERVRTKELARLDPRELRLLFETLAVLDGAAALPVLEHHLKRGGELRQAAAYGLARLEDPRAEALLASGARSLHPGKRAACKRALDQKILIVAAEPPTHPPAEAVPETRYPLVQLRRK